MEKLGGFQPISNANLSQLQLRFLARRAGVSEARAAIITAFVFPEVAR
jgi:hypothetical protein